MNQDLFKWLPAAAVFVSIISVAGWMRLAETHNEPARVPIPENQWELGEEEVANPGTTTSGPGEPSDLEGEWVQFRGADQRNIVWDSGPVAETLPDEGLRVFWEREAGEGHAGAAIKNGCVYLMDYDMEKEEDVILCLNLETGEEIWRYTYSVSIKRNHGISRTVPAVTDDYVVTIGPFTHTVCLDAKTGELVWKMDMRKEYGTIVPPWYVGQCPIIEDGKVILAVCGNYDNLDNPPPGEPPLLMARDLATGEILWETPNPGYWGQTHASIRAIDMHGVHQYVYCAEPGVVSVDAATGEILWTDETWYNRTAYVPTPVVLPENKLFLTSGYNAGAAIMHVSGRNEAEIIRRLDARREFGSDQQTPIFYEGYLYGVTTGGEMVCLDPEGNLMWESGPKNKYGLGPYILADGKILILHDMEGTLHIIEATPDGFNEMDSVQVLKGHDAWAPMAIAAGRIILRDITHIKCIELPRP
jgi:outer membrane protein assembly factor BamB